MYTSPNFVNDVLNAAIASLVGLNFYPLASTPDPSSSAWNLKFSNNMIYPPVAAKQAFSTSSPTHSGKN